MLLTKHNINIFDLPIELIPLIINLHRKPDYCYQRLMSTCIYFHDILKTTEYIFKKQFKINYLINHNLLSRYKFNNLLLRENNIFDIVYYNYIKKLDLQTNRTDGIDLTLFLNLENLTLTTDSLFMIITLPESIKVLKLCGSVRKITSLIINNNLPHLKYYNFPYLKYLHLDNILLLLFGLGIINLVVAILAVFLGKHITI